MSPWAPGIQSIISRRVTALNSTEASETSGRASRFRSFPHIVEATRWCQRNKLLWGEASFVGAGNGTPIPHMQWAQWSWTGSEFRWTWTDASTDNYISRTSWGKGIEQMKWNLLSMFSSSCMLYLFFYLADFCFSLAIFFLEVVEQLRLQHVSRIL